MHQVVGAATCSHQRKAKSEARHATVPILTCDFPCAEQAEAHIGCANQQITDPNNEPHHDVAPALIPIGTPIWSRNSSMKVGCARRVKVSGATAADSIPQFIGT